MIVFAAPWTTRRMSVISTRPGCTTRTQQRQLFSAEYWSREERDEPNHIMSQILSEVFPHPFHISGHPWPQSFWSIAGAGAVCLSSCLRPVFTFGAGVFLKVLDKKTIYVALISFRFDKPSDGRVLGFCVESFSLLISLKSLSQQLESWIFLAFLQASH